MNRTKKYDKLFSSVFFFRTFTVIVAPNFKFDIVFYNSFKFNLRDFDPKNALKLN